MRCLDIEHLIASYPRTRPPLSPQHQRIFESEYKQNRQGGTVITAISQKLESWMHKKVALSVSGSILKLGAGTLNHVPYEKFQYYDIVEPFHYLYADSIDRHKIRNAYDSIHAIPASSTYSRIISIAVLEHIQDLPDVLVKSYELLDDGGVFQAGIPCEGGLLWGLAWRMTTGLAYRLRTGLSYRAIMRHEHINNYFEITKLIEHTFKNIKISYFPALGVHGAFYAYIEAHKHSR